MRNVLLICLIENDLDEQNPCEDDPDIYLDDEARVFNDEDELVMTLRPFIYIIFRDLCSCKLNNF